MKQILSEVRKTISRYNMIREGDRVIVAVSGGADSICLLDVLSALANELDITLITAHFEHGLRPLEDPFETALVCEYARSLNLPFETEKASGIDLTSSSLEEKARELRYDFFERVRKRYNADIIAMGHNLNDQAETVLMRLLRGSGIAGLSGIPPVRDNIIIRPLIETSREDILRYLEERQLRYAVDSSNNDTRFTRNRIRQVLMPEMIKYQPELIEILGRLSDHLREENSLVETWSDEWIKNNFKKNQNDEYLIDIRSVKALHHALIKRIIRGIVKSYNNSAYSIESDHVQEIFDLLFNPKPNITINLPGNLIARKEYNSLIFSCRSSFPDSFCYELRSSGETSINEIGRRIRIDEISSSPQISVETDANTALLDKELLSYPLTVRNFRPGDRFIPLGMKGHRKLKDFFIDLKIPAHVRKQIPVILKDDQIIWVGGYRIDERFKVTPVTNEILKISLI
ncbi:MAG: tRNA lysidine(34) synthetase TilS [Methanosarcina sp.]|nr:tRNA lysidine(34) synthetase TilS [Methanosarcina sp.]